MRRRKKGGPWGEAGRNEESRCVERMDGRKRGSNTCRMTGKDRGRTRGREWVRDSRTLLRMHRFESGRLILPPRRITAKPRKFPIATDAEKWRGKSEGMPRRPVATLFSLLQSDLACHSLSFSFFLSTYLFLCASSLLFTVFLQRSFFPRTPCCAALFFQRFLFSPSWPALVNDENCSPLRDRPLSQLVTVTNAFARVHW